MLPPTKPVIKASPIPVMPPPVRNISPVQLMSTAKPVAASTPEPKTALAADPAPVQTSTSDLSSKKTNRTLVEFQSKSSTLPDWRLQLQNSVRLRSSGLPRQSDRDMDAVAGSQKHLVTSGSNALKAETATPPHVAVHTNPRVANALKRIENSRQAFLTQIIPTASASVASKTAVPRNYPFNVIGRSSVPSNNLAELSEPPSAKAKPRLVSSMRIEKKGLDTNKLLPIPQPAALVSSFDAKTSAEFDDLASKSFQFQDKAGRNEATLDIGNNDEYDSVETDEIDDLAPISMRFGAGLFDVIIGIFATAILLSPLMLSGGAWVSFSGLLAFMAALAIVLFIYLTASVGIVGRTFGMRLFSLEMIDAEENAYPTLHQAAVSSAVYLVSLALGGLGFVPVLFNEEKRAMHDLMSGTIMIREV